MKTDILEEMVLELQRVAIDLARWMNRDDVPEDVGMAAMRRLSSVHDVLIAWGVVRVSTERNRKKLCKDEEKYQLDEACAQAEVDAHEYRADGPESGK